MDAPPILSFDQTQELFNKVQQSYFTKSLIKFHFPTSLKQLKVHQPTLAIKVEAHLI